MDWSKLKSRKLWVTIAGCVGLTALAVHGAPPEVIASVALVAVTYLGAQSAVDVSGGERDWKSRKLWGTILGSIGITVLGEGGATPEIIETVRYLIMAFVGGQGLVDFMNAKKKLPPQ